MPPKRAAPVLLKALIVKDEKVRCGVDMDKRRNRNKMSARRLRETRRCELERLREHFKVSSETIRMLADSNQKLREYIGGAAPMIEEPGGVMSSDEEEQTPSYPLCHGVRTVQGVTYLAVVERGAPAVQEAVTSSEGWPSYGECETAGKCYSYVVERAEDIANSLDVDEHGLLLD